MCVLENGADMRAVLQEGADASPSFRDTTASQARQCMLADGIAELLHVAASQGEHRYKEESVTASPASVRHANTSGVVDYASSPHR